jgi:hypothetical protein
VRNDSEGQAGERVSSKEHGDAEGGFGGTDKRDAQQ